MSKVDLKVVIFLFHAFLSLGKVGDTKIDYRKKGSNLSTGGPRFLHFPFRPFEGA